MADYLGYGDLNWSLDLKRSLSGKKGTDAPDRVVIERAILKAEGIANAYLGVRYEMPIAETSESAALKSAVEDIAKYRLYVDHSESGMPEKVDKAHDEAIAYLKELAKKLVTLGLDTDDEKEAGKDVFSSFVRG
jgi:phage gp36-like protein